jgi:hypothetical protein
MKGRRRTRKRLRPSAHAGAPGARTAPAPARKEGLFSARARGSNASTKGKAQRPYEFGVKGSLATTLNRSKGGQFDLAENVSPDPAEIGADRLQRPVGALELLASLGQIRVTGARPRRRLNESKRASPRWKADYRAAAGVVGVNDAVPCLQVTRSSRRPRTGISFLRWSLSKPI